MKEFITSLQNIELRATGGFAIVIILMSFGSLICFVAQVVAWIIKVGKL